MYLSRIGSLRFLSALMAVLLTAALLVLLQGGGQPAVGWATGVTGGMGDANNITAYSMATYNSRLYVGTDNSSTGCEVWSTDGVSWLNETLLVGGGFGNANNTIAMSMTVFNSQLYVGTWNSNGCEVWRFDGTTWSQTVGQGLPGTPTAPGFANNDNDGVSSLFVYNSILFAGTWNDNSGCEVWANGGLIWTPLVGSYPGSLLGPGFGNTSNTRVISMAEYGNLLYMGISNFPGGCMIWRFDGVSLTQVVGNLPGTVTPSGFGFPNNVEVLSMALFNGQLYAGTNNFTSGCEIWRTSDGLTWERKVGSGWPGNPDAPGFGDPNNTLAYSMLVYDSRLFVGTFNNNGCQLWSSFNGGFWVEEVGPGLSGDNAPGFGDANNWTVSSLGMLNSRFYAGTLNYGTGCEVRFDRFSTTWYLAEGATAGGYETWILVQNPNAFPVDIDIRYQTGSGEVAGPTGTIPAASRSSYLVNSTVETFDVSTKVNASGNVVCERAVYWTPPGSGIKEVGHDSIGVTNPATTWYMAEGASTGGYETWILVQNPNDFDVSVNIGFYTENGYVVGPLDTVPALSRKSFLVNETVESYDVSTTVWGTDNVICERAVYWTPPGASAKVLGTDCIGVTDAAQAWYMAEGATTGGYETWVLVQNPGLDPADVDIKYQTAAGEVQGPVGSIPASTRKSYRVNDTVQTYDVSIKVSAKAPVICERSMYWTPPGAANKILGHDSVGVTAPWDSWYLAEGSTTGGYETWVLVQNPEVFPVDIEIHYLTGSGPVTGPTATIPAAGRRSFRVSDTVETYDVSTHVKTSSPGYIICERAVYWTPPGAPFKVLGTNSIGWPDL